MNKIYWLFQTREISDALLRRPDYFVAGIKKSILHSRLSRLHAFIKSMNLNPALVSQVIPMLNRMFSASKLSFTWFPATNDESSCLLIRNTDIGLLLPTSNESAPRAMMMISEFTNQDNNLIGPGFCEALAENVLLKLSNQVRSKNKSAVSPARTSKASLTIV